MPSFDIVSEVDHQELKNAVNQALKEVSQRYDFRGSKSNVELEEGSIHLTSDDEYKLKALLDILKGKLVKRGISLKSIREKKVEEALGGLRKMDLELIQGIDKENAKGIIKHIKDAKLKVQGSVQGDQLRVTGKKRDDLQDAISAVKAMNAPIELQFVNFRD